jgi:ribosome-interacting GTPase 1
MPANLTPAYFEAEKRYRRASTPHEKIEALEDMLSVMPKHKGTDRLRAELRTKLAKSYDELQKKPYIAKKGSLLYYVGKEGAAQVVLVGLTNVGKSQLVCAVTEAAPEVAAYPFTTQMPVPAMMRFENTQIQLVDLPAVTAPQVDSWLGNVIRSADLMLIVVDLAEDPVAQMETITERLRKYRVAYRDEPEDTDFRTTRKRALIVGNKTDLDRSREGYDRLVAAYGDLPRVNVSVKEGDGLEQLGKAIYEALDVIRVYTKAPGQKADPNEPFVVRKGSTVEEVAASIHKDFLSNLKYAQVWGSGKFDGQKVKRQYVLQEGDIVELHT